MSQYLVQPLTSSIRTMTLESLCHYLSCHFYIFCVYAYLFSKNEQLKPKGQGWVKF